MKSCRIQVIALVDKYIHICIYKICRLWELVLASPIYKMYMLPHHYQHIRLLIDGVRLVYGPHEKQDQTIAAAKVIFGWLVVVF